jgi:hypothetical protein
MVYLTNPDGNDFDTSPKMERSLHVLWSTKLNLSHSILHLDINTVMKFLGLMNKPNDSFREW